MRKLLAALQFAAVAGVAIAASQPGTARAFDPQPEPPAVYQWVVNPGVIRGVSPQPIPPGTIRGVSPQPSPPGTIQGFNPQPDPPHDPFKGAAGDGSV